MTNLDSILKNRDITLPTKVRLVKAMVFPVALVLVLASGAWWGGGEDDERCPPARGHGAASG